MPYTGGGPQALYLAQDKSLAKKIFDFHKIKTPDFATSYKGRTDTRTISSFRSSSSPSPKTAPSASTPAPSSTASKS